jgi:hypothetical protein
MHTVFLYQVRYDLTDIDWMSARKFQMSSSDELFVRLTVVL